jgi:hypothetical protein
MFIADNVSSTTVTKYRALKYAVRNNARSHTYFSVTLHECSKFTRLRHSITILYTFVTILYTFVTQLEMLLPWAEISLLIQAGI